MYGTTTVGGTFGVGTAYKLTTTGTLTVLHAFGGIGDGGPPMAGLINVNGTLYGTTYAVVRTETERFSRSRRKSYRSAIKNVGAREGERAPIGKATDLVRPAR